MSMEFVPNKDYEEAFIECDVEWFFVDQMLDQWGSVDCLFGLRNRLDVVRQDRGYHDAKEFLAREGFTEPLAYMVDDYPGRERFMQCNGHHRLAAAIDLGYRFIPYINVQGEIFIQDVGTWCNPEGDRLLHMANFNVDFRHAESMVMA
jgi:hypothetical protein